ncbi:MAG: DUF47 family protein [Clostridia bacterium]|nr:DUF47 family protein [Clostridia bacterium]
MMLFSKNNSSKVHALIMEQIKDVEGCLIEFENFLLAALKPETTMDTLYALSSGVHQMENAADRSLRVMIDSLGGAFLPSSREELISIATSCDKIANKCEHIALMMCYQRFRFPHVYDEDIRGMLAAIREEYNLLKESISLLFSRFGDLLEDHSILDRIREQESLADAIEDKLHQRIFAMEDYDLAHQMQMSNFVEEIGNIADTIENIADKIQIMLISRKA